MTRSRGRVRTADSCRSAENRPPLGLTRSSTTRLAGSRTGSSRRIRASMSANADVTAPMARPSEMMAAEETIASLRRRRRPRRMSRPRDSSQFRSLTSRLASRISRRRPNFCSACAAAASRVRPRATRSSARLDVKSLLLFDLTRHAIGAHDIDESRPPGHIALFLVFLAFSPCGPHIPAGRPGLRVFQTRSSTWLTASVTVRQRVSCVSSCWRPASVTS